MNKFSVKSSLIHGQGLFANMPIKKGEVVVHWKNTKEISQAEFAALPLSEKKYTDIQDGKILLVGAPERYVNHSCHCNTVPGHLCEIAARDIKEGEEITANYGNFFILAGSFECTCGGAGCLGVIYGKKTE